MAPIAIGEWMGSACIAKMVGKFCSYLEDQCEYQRDANDKLTRLKNNLWKIPVVLHKASSLQTKDPSIESWLGSIKDAGYQAEDVLDLFEYRFLEARAEEKGNVMADTDTFDYASVGSCSSTMSTTTNTIASTITSSSSTVKWSVILKRFLFSDEDLNKLIAIVDKFDKIASDLQTFLELVKPRDRKPGKTLQWRRTTSMLGTTKFFGRGVEEVKLTKLLQQSNDKTNQPYSVIAIVGVAGVGKTVLLQRIYSHFRDIEHFDIIAWLYVSEKFGVKRLTKEMVQSQECRGLKRNRDGTSRISWHSCISADFNSSTSLDIVQRILQEKLDGSRILVVLDDIWNEMSSKWETFCKPLQFASKGSKVVLTTRSQKVAEINGATEIIYLNGLKDEEYFGHFIQCAFGNSTPSHFPGLGKIGIKLAKKLDGSPLAAKTVGGELKQKMQEDHWENVLRNKKLWQIKQTADDIMPALKLSYDHLPDHLKPCFVYFALFPKNCQLHGDVLIQMWRAHGYIQKETSDGNAYRYINDLLQLSFIKKAANQDNHYVVNGLLHDMAEWISNEEHFRIEDDFHVPVPGNVRHLYVTASNISKVRMSLNETQDLKENLRSLIICNHDALSGERIHPGNFNESLKETLHELRSLRVLVLQHSDGILPDIKHLVHLRYLDIHESSRCTSFPESLFRLYHLQSFNVPSHCQYNKGKELQKHISRLTSHPVKCLNIPGSISNFRHQNDRSTRGSESWL